jgi:hypothetical protein
MRKTLTARQCETLSCPAVDEGLTR